MLNLQSRTLVKVSAGKYCLGFRTISRLRKSSREFLVTREELKELEREIGYEETVTIPCNELCTFGRDSTEERLKYGKSCPLRKCPVPDWFFMTRKDCAPVWKIGPSAGSSSALCGTILIGRAPTKFAFIVISRRKKSLA